MSGTPNQIPDWYINLQAAVLKQLPRPGEIDSEIALGWERNHSGLKKALAEVLCPPQNHTIDLAKSPRLPFDNAEVVKHEGKGVVTIELRSDDNLYIDGEKVVLNLSERQTGNKRVVGHELREELESGEQVLLNSNVLDYLYEHPELFPKCWKKNEQGETLYIFFWGSIFRRLSDGSLCVRCLSWRDGELRWGYRWLADDWDRRDPSASVAS